MEFDLSRFRNLAFGRKKLPDHPVATEADAREMVESLPRHDPAAALAEITACVLSINEDASFSPARRARVLMELDVAAHQFWRPLGEEFLALEGVPREGRDGDPRILHAFQESAAEFAAGFAQCVTAQALAARWIKTNRVAVMLRRARWLTRKMILSRMLHLPGADERWTELNDLYRLAAECDLFRNVAAVFPGNPRTSSVKQEYVRMLLLDIIRPDRMLGRDMELAYRLIGRIASSVQLETTPIEGAQYFIVPRGAEHPVALFRHSGAVPEGALYLHVGNALPRLKAMLERDVGTDGAEPDPVFGMVYTVRERRALITYMLNEWGKTPTQRRAQRILMSGKAALVHGIDGVTQVVRRHDQGGWSADQDSRSSLRIQFDRDHSQARVKTQRELACDLLDASDSGVGVALPRKDTRWAKPGTLVAILSKPGGDWLVGVVRRLNADGEQMRLGISVLSHKPRVVWCQILDTGHLTVWDDEKKFERNFQDYFQKGVLLELPGKAMEAGEILFAPNASTRGTCFDVPIAGGAVRLRITAIREQTQDFQRVLFEPLPASAKT